jgi:hypothetical protein
MKDITAVNQSVKQFWYDHSEAIVDFKAYINQGEDGTNYPPGAFNNGDPALVVLWPDADGVNINNRWRMFGWLEEMRVEVSIGTPNTLIGKIRVTGDVTMYWVST